MTAIANLPILEEGITATLQNFLQQLIEKKIVQAILVPVQTCDARSVQPALVVDSKQLDRAVPLLPVLPVSGARLASRVARNASARIAVIMRPCELRAVEELVKLNQIDRHALLMIGVDCIGTYEVVDLKEAQGSPEGYTQTVIEAMRTANPDAPGELSYRHACTICETLVAWHADIKLHLIGVAGGLLVEVSDETLLDALELIPGADVSVHQQAVDDLTELRHERREAELDSFAAHLQSGENGTPELIRAFETCQSCYNCTVACPICICKQCLFNTTVFDSDSKQIMDWAIRNGAVRLPGNVSTFQLTRLLHVSTSCVGCGLCTSACPAHLPVDTLFQTVARETQRLFEYVPGYDGAAPLPTASFRTDEFVAFGETET